MPVTNCERSNKSFNSQGVNHNETFRGNGLVESPSKSGAFAIGKRRSKKDGARGIINRLLVFLVMTCGWSLLFHYFDPMMGEVLRENLELQMSVHFNSPMEKARDKVKDKAHEFDRDFETWKEERSPEKWAEDGALLQGILTRVQNAYGKEKIDKNKTYRLIHVINTFAIEKDGKTEQPYDQWVTLQSIERAKKYAPKKLDITLVCAMFTRDYNILTEEMVPQCDRRVLLKRSTVTEYGTLSDQQTNDGKTTPEEDKEMAEFFSQTEFPFIQDMLNEAKKVASEKSDDEYYIMLTNIDIGLTKNFYDFVLPKFQDQRLAFSINRVAVDDESITIKAPTIDPQKIEQLFQEIDAVYEQGTQHGGHDCFLIKSSIIDKINLGDLFAGQPGWAGSLYHILSDFVARGSYKVYKSLDAKATFHLGGPGSWKESWKKDEKRFVRIAGIVNEKREADIYDCYQGPINHSPFYTMNVANCGKVFRENYHYSFSHYHQRSKKRRQHTTIKSYKIYRQPKLGPLVFAKESGDKHTQIQAEYDAWNDKGLPLPLEEESWTYEDNFERLDPAFRQKLESEKATERKLENLQESQNRQAPPSTAQSKKIREHPVFERNEFTVESFPVAGVDLALYGLEGKDTPIQPEKNNEVPFELFEDFDLSSQLIGNETWVDLIRYRRDAQFRSLSFYVDKVARKRWLPTTGMDGPKSFVLKYGEELITSGTDTMSPEEQHQKALLELLPVGKDFAAKPTHLSCADGIWLTKNIGNRTFIGNGKKPMTESTDISTDSISNMIAKDLAKQLQKVQNSCGSRVMESTALQNVRPGIVVEERFMSWDGKDDRGGMEFKVFTIWGRMWLAIQRPGMDGATAILDRNGTNFEWEGESIKLPWWIDWPKIVEIAEKSGANKDMFRTDIFVGTPSSSETSSTGMSLKERLKNVRYVISESEIYPTEYFHLRGTKQIFDEGARLWLAGYTKGNYRVVPNTEVPFCFAHHFVCEM